MPLFFDTFNWIVKRGVGIDGICEYRSSRGCNATLSCALCWRFSSVSVTHLHIIRLIFLDPPTLFPSLLNKWQKNFIGKLCHFEVSASPDVIYYFVLLLLLHTISWSIYPLVQPHNAMTLSRDTLHFLAHSLNRRNSISA